MYTLYIAEFNYPVAKLYGGVELFELMLTSVTIWNTECAGWDGDCTYYRIVEECFGTTNCPCDSCFNERESYFDFIDPASEIE